MAFKYGTTSPTAIKYNGTDLTVLKYGTTAVWGKPYSLSISAGSNTTVTVSRTSSPNQGASTGTLSSGSVIYYGDVLTISYSVSSGYAISTHTVNGTTFTSGQQFTVTSAISVVTTAVASTSWKTVWTGSSRQRLDNVFVDDDGYYYEFTGNFSTPTTLVTGRQTRITAVVTYDTYGNGPSETKTIGVQGQNTFSKTDSGGGNAYLVLTSYDANKIYGYTWGNFGNDYMYMNASSITITKIEQYY